MIHMLIHFYYAIILLRTLSLHLPVRLSSVYH